VKKTKLNSLEQIDGVEESEQSANSSKMFKNKFIDGDKEKV